MSYTEIELRSIFIRKSCSLYSKFILSLIDQSGFVVRYNLAVSSCSGLFGHVDLDAIPYGCNNFDASSRALVILCRSPVSANVSFIIGNDPSEDEFQVPCYMMGWPTAET